jgi:hypothetical protein
VKEFAKLIAIGIWVAGVVLASGWWKVLAFCVPFYSWYVVIKALLA